MVVTRVYATVVLTRIPNVTKRNIRCVLVAHTFGVGQRYVRLLSAGQRIGYYARRLHGQRRSKPEPTKGLPTNAQLQTVLAR